LITFLAFLGISLPFVLHLKEKYLQYKLEKEGLSYSLDLLELTEALIKDNKVKSANLVNKLRKLSYSVGKILNVKDKWDKLEVQIEHYLEQQIPSHEDLLNIAFQITMMDSIIFENSGAIADPDKAAINLIIAHYLSFPPILFAYIKKQKVPFFLISVYLENYRYAFMFKRDLRKVLPITFFEKGADFFEILKLDRLALSWVKDYTFEREHSTRLLFLFTLFTFFSGQALIVWLVFSVLKSFSRGVKAIEELADSIKSGTFHTVKSKILLWHGENECEKSLKKLVSAMEIQRDIVIKIKLFLDALNRGEFKEITKEETSGIWKEIFKELKLLTYQLSELKEILAKYSTLINTGEFYEVVEVENLSRPWQAMLYPLQNAIKRLDEFTQGIGITLWHFSHGVFEIRLPKVMELKGRYQEIYESFKDLRNNLDRILFEINRVTEEIIGGNLIVDIQIESFEGEFQSLLIMLDRIIQKMRRQMESIKYLWEEEEELLLFKQTIEEDKDIETVYNRIKELLKNKFGLKRFAFYEINSSQNYMIKRVIYPESANFCNKEVFTNAELCRCKKVGQPVWGEDEKWGKVCPMFLPEEKYYICYPFVFEEGVKFILQVVCESKEEFYKVRRGLSKIKRYIENIIPLITIKELTIKHKIEE